MSENCETIHKEENCFHDDQVLVSIVMPVYNAELFLDESLQSILDQTWKDSLELSIYNDCSEDSSLEIINEWKDKFVECGISVVLNSKDDGTPGGVGRSRNKAIQQSHGKYLCFFDADDIMLPQRLECQLAVCRTTSDTIVGSCFKRLPEDSTPRYTKWCANLTQSQLSTQVYTSFGPTIIQPSWFCPREVFTTIGPFVETGKGIPEDLIFFYKHLDKGGKVMRVNKSLLIYRYHNEAATFSVKQETILSIRVTALEQNILKDWNEFTIWNAGKQGRRFLRLLSKESQSKVIAFCDVDEKKISKGLYTCEFEKPVNGTKRKIPIVHFSEAKPPFIICVKLDMSNGCFEDNLASLRLIEGKDYIHFN